MDKNTRTGLSAEFRFAAEALERDFRVAWPTAQSPWDLIIESPINGKVFRVQVKSVASTRREVGLGRRDRVTRKYRPYYPGEYDVLAIHHRGEWYIVPANQIPEKSQWSYLDWRHYRDWWELLT